MGQLLLHTFLFPGNVVCGALGVSEGEDKVMVRTLINMLVWNAVVLIGAILIFD